MTPDEQRLAAQEDPLTQRVRQRLRQALVEVAEGVWASVPVEVIPAVQQLAAYPRGTTGWRHQADVS